MTLSIFHCLPFDINAHGNSNDPLMTEFQPNRDCVIAEFPSNHPRVTTEFPLQLLSLYYEELMKSSFLRQKRDICVWQISYKYTVWIQVIFLVIIYETDGNFKTHELGSTMVLITFVNQSFLRTVSVTILRFTETKHSGTVANTTA